jgi:long-chain acyl-CoA synthetase
MLFTQSADTFPSSTNHCPIPIIVASSNHLTDVLKIAPHCPSLRVIVSMDPISAAERDVVTQWASSLGILFLDMTEFESWGMEPANFVAPGPLAGEQDLDSQRIASISYTSGTTGNPKGVVLTNWNMTSAVISTAYGIGKEILNLKEYRFFSYLPLAHVYERLLQIVVFYGDGTVCLSTGDTLKLLEDAAIMKPHFFPGVPRVFNRIHSAVKMQMDTPGLKGALLRRAVYTKLDNYRATGDVTHRLYDALVFRKLRALLGGEVLYMCSGAAPLSATVQEMLKICFSCDVVQGYGMTETIGTCSKGIPSDIAAPGTCGQIQPCNEVRLVDVAEMGYTHKDQPHPRGELCLRGDNIFKGYLHDPENTAKTIDAEGWMHTGDIAEIDQSGRLKIVDRVKNVVKLSQGEYVALEKVEGIYALNPLYTTLLVHADSLRSSLVAIGVLEPTLAAKLIRDVTGKEVDPTDVARLEAALEDPKIRKKMVDDFAKVSKKNKLNGFEMIRGVFARIRPFEDDLMTPTLKVKR